MRVLLCTSYLGEDQSGSVVFPLGLAYLASVLTEHDVSCWDSNVEKNPMVGLRRTLENFNPDVVCVSLRNIDNVFSSKQKSYYEPFEAMVKLIKESAPSTKLIVGGTGFSIFSKEIMERNSEIDFGVVSEGERAIVNLLQDFQHPERVKNLVFRQSGKIVYTEKDDFVDFNTLAPPSRDCFDLTKYSKSPFSIGIQSSRGCSFNCIYCLSKLLMGSCYRLRSPVKVVDEIETLVNQHGINGFYFVEPVFNVPFDHSRAILNEIRKRKLDVKWEACFRPDFLSERTMAEAIEAGCQLFDFSPDGASNEAMNLLGKNLDVLAVEKTVNWVKKLENAKVAYEFVYDLPYGNRKHVMGLSRIVPKIISKCRNKIQYLTFTKMRIYPHTRLYDIALNQHKIAEQTDLLNIVHFESSSKNPWNLVPFLLKGFYMAFDNLYNRFS